METRDIELMLMRTWPAIEERTYDGWVLRFSRGYTKRSNCINPLYESYFDLEEKFEYCRKIYKEKRLPIIYKLIDTKVSLMVDEFLEKKGLKKQDMVTVKEIDLTDVDYNLKSISINWGFSKEWYDFYTAENNLNTEEKDIIKKLLEKNDKNNVYVCKSINNEIIAVAMGSVEKNRMGIFNVYVKDTYRKKGYATEILEGLLVEARKINVEKAYLQVMETNERALKLYKKMGFVLKYKTWYRY